MNSKKLLHSLIQTLFFSLCIHTSYAADSAPQVVVSIAPLYALVSGVMENVGTPILLLKPGTSPHHYALKPSEAKLLYNADLIVWAGPHLESFLTKSIDNVQSVRPHVHNIPLVETPGLLLLPVRSNATFEPHTHGEGEDHHDHDHANHIDMHFWLDPLNAKHMVTHLAQQLSKADPAHQAHYHANAQKLKEKLNTLHQRMQIQLKPVQKMPYIVFHDAYQYFEHRYGLNGVGAITVNPEIPPSAKRLTSIQTLINKTQATCVFSEPQFQPKIIQTIIQGTHAHTGELDPLGNITEPGLNNYIHLLDNLSQALNQCYSKK